jgi:hypothetical protein
MISSTPARRTISPSRTWPAYAAAAWLVVFVMWHVPMTLGWDVLPASDTAEPGPVSRVVFHAYNLTLIGMAAVGTLVVLATVRPWGRRFPRWVVLTPLWIGCGLLVLRGVPGFVELVLQVTGVAPAGLMGLVDHDLRPATGPARWAEYAINLYFFLGALLLLPATLRYQRGAVIDLPSS